MVEEESEWRGEKALSDGCSCHMEIEPTLHSQVHGRSRKFSLSP
jgi:hypothetical protein